MPWSEREFRRPRNAAALAEAIRGLTGPARPLRLMEICGTHTMAIARAGLRELLAPGVQLLSGPGCPVCVTPAGAIDGVLALSERPGLVIASYGDLLRVPGSVRGDTLLRRKALGAAVDRVFLPAASVWRGLGEIPASGYALRPEFAPWDAARKFGFAPGPGAEVPGCRCGAVLRGACAPRACPLFGRACTPADPVGPCMVSAEGACAAAYQYGAPTEAAAAHGG